MKHLLEEEFSISVEKIKALDGYDNKNYKVTGAAEGRFVFKTYKSSASLHDVLVAENETLLFLEEKMDDKTPRPVHFKDDSFIKVLEVDHEHRICRMLTFLEGRFLGEVPHSNELFQSLGLFLAEMDRHLSTLRLPVLEARRWEWDHQYFELNRKYLQDISEARDRHIVLYYLNQYEEVVRPLFPQLRQHVIHNDPNEWNVLVEDDQITGIIDFGDVTHSFLINELAIAIAYACYDKDEPLEWALIILASYHSLLPLEEVEIKVLYYLIAARLCTTVSNSAHAKKTDPDNSYASSSEANAWKMLHKWLSISPIRAENEFRKAIGLEEIKPAPIEHLIQNRKKYFSSNLSTSYEQPIHMVGAAFQYMYDASGNSYLDAYNNIPHVGHSHPIVVTAGQKQMVRLNTNTRYVYEELATYAEKLLSYFPASLSKVFLVNSGSAASDLAIRMAQCHTGMEHIMVMESGYHGNTKVSIDISDYKFNSPKGDGQKDYILKTPLADSYKGKYAGMPEAGRLYGRDVVQLIEESPAGIAAFICEPVLGCAGQVPLAQGYLEEVYPAIRAQNGVCISDEVQTGFGRLGRYFWGYEAQDVIPDIVILGKPIANGHPMGAVVCTEEIAASFEDSVEFFSSFGGNPVSCAIASALLDVMEEERLQDNAERVGQHYKTLLKALAEKYPCIGDVRGLGLFIGIEIVKDGTQNPDTALAQHIKNELRHRHILISTDGPYDNVIKTKPPLCFTKKNAEQVVSALELILEVHYSTNTDS